MCFFQGGGRERERFDYDISHLSQMGVCYHRLFLTVSLSKRSIQNRALNRTNMLGAVSRGKEL